MLVNNLPKYAPLFEHIVAIFVEYVLKYDCFLLGQTKKDECKSNRPWDIFIYATKVCNGGFSNITSLLGLSM